MSEFARVLSEIIDQGKKEKIFSIKELAQQARITPSYLSNLKQSNRKPPAQKTLLKLTDALRVLHVAESSVQRLIDAYNRQHLNYQDTGSLLESLIDEYKEEGSLFERLRQGVQTKGVVLKTQTGTRASHAPEELRSGFCEGGHRTFILKAIQLLERTQYSGVQGGSIYLTWFHHDFADNEFRRDREKLRDALRSFLWVDSPFRALHLWAGDIAREMSVIVDFLIQYIGTSHCFLFEIPYGQHLPEYFAVEGVGFIEAKPVSENQYWIRTVLVDEKETQPAMELTGLIQYLEYLLGPPAIRTPMVKTNAPSERFSITPVTRKLADTEQVHIKKELLLIKSSLSARYRPAGPIRELLELSGLPQEKLDLYITHHQQRMSAQEKRLEVGRERAIHEKEFLRQEFRTLLPQLSLSSSSNEEQSRYLEAHVLKGQILGVLRAIQRNPNCHFALADQEFLIRFSLNGDTAFLAFDPPDAQEEFPLNRDDLLVRAWTEHPDVVYQLRHEFDTIWKTIDPRWRTDNEEGRRNVVSFFIADPLKALFNADVPGSELWGFIAELVEQAAYSDVEAFTRDLYTHEQAATRMFFLSSNFPLITIPSDIGPWDPRSSIRTRQIVFYALLRDIEHIHLVLSQQHAEAYWETGQYGTHTFHREWIRQHVHYFCGLLHKFPEKITVELVPQQERFPVNVEVINGEWVFFQKADTLDTPKGIILQDRELADTLMSYVSRNLSARCPEALQGAQNAARWIQETFGIDATED